MQGYFIFYGYANRTPWYQGAPTPCHSSNIFAGLNGSGAMAGIQCLEKPYRVMDYMVLRELLCNYQTSCSLQFMSGFNFIKPLDSVPFKPAGCGAGSRLVASQATNPHIQTMKRSFKRFNLPNSTTFLPVFDALVEKVNPLFVYHPFNIGWGGEKNFNVLFIPKRGTLNELVGFVE